MFLPLKDKDVEKIITHLNNNQCLFIETETNRKINLTNKMILRNLIFNRTIIPFGEVDETGNIVNLGILNSSSENPKKNYISIQYVELENNEFLRGFVEFSIEYCKKNSFGKIKLILNPKVIEKRLGDVMSKIEMCKFEKEIEYNNMVGKQIVFARFVDDN